MACRYGERHQSLLLLPSIEDYVGPDDPVRAYDAVVDALDLEGLGITVEAHKRGCPEYFPRVMLKILAFGYAYRPDRGRQTEELHRRALLGARTVCPRWTGTKRRSWSTSGVRSRRTVGWTR